MITKAIILAAGWGTRRLPITKSVEKCMLPIGNRPVIDYVVQDAILAGIKDIYFVVNSEDNQIEKYYKPYPKLEQYLNFAGKPEYLRYIAPPQGVNFYFIEQEVNTKYGTAIPVGLCFPYIRPGESVAVLTGDDFIYNYDGSSELARLIMQTPQGASSMLSVEVDPNRVGEYGVIEFDTQGNYYQIVEKPSPENSPSNYINISKYILNYEVLQVAAAYSKVDITGEYALTEPINQYVLTGGTMKVVLSQGKYFDSGNAYAWVEANRTVLGV